MGVPLFTARPDSLKGGFIYPDRWQTFKPHHRQVEIWAPGSALCLVTGVVFDALDVDPRNGGGEGWEQLNTAGAVPPILGVALTPSEGRHYLIARTHLAKTSKAARGVDLQAGQDDGEGRGFLFIAPTVRMSRFGAHKGLDVAYAWVKAPSAPDTSGETPAMERLRKVIAINRGGRARTAGTKGSTKGGTKTPDPDLDAFADMVADWTPESAERAIQVQLDAVQAAREGEINNALGGAARVLGRFVAGDFLDEESATARLLEALEAGGVHDDAWNLAHGKKWTAATVIGAGLANGAKEPWSVERVERVESPPAAPGDVTTGGPGDSAPAGIGTAAPGEQTTHGGIPTSSVPITVGERQNQPMAASELPAPGMPMDVARALVTAYPRALTWWRGDFYTWEGTHWITEDEADVRGWIRLATERATYLKPIKGKDGGPVTFESVNWAPTISKVREVAAALGEGVLRRQGEDDRVLALANGVLDLASRRLAAHSPRVFNLTSRPFRYDGEASCPHWDTFLEQVLPDGKEDQAFLQEWFGYVLSGRTDIHAVASLAGMSRSGKGTILRVLTAMTGTENVAAGRLDALAGPFGLEPLIGKSLLAFGDVRWNNANAQTAIQRILEISGEDKVTVPRKNRTDWEGTLGVRVMFAGNEVPRFTDPSRAMANRLRIVHFMQSFAGREDYGLTERLMGELSGIFNWALEGLDRLTAEGRFTESARSARLRDRVGEGGDSLTSFVDEYLEPQDGAWCYEDDVMAAYAEWCERTRRTRDSSTAETIRSAVLDLYPGVTNDGSTRRSKRTELGPRKVRAFQGLRMLGVIPGTEFSADHTTGIEDYADG
jgi:putative DNA primase/helicase